MTTKPNAAPSGPRNYRVKPDKALRAAVFRLWGYQCVWCGSEQPPMTLDHLKTVRAGGTTTLGNCVPSCISCNSRRGAKQLTLAALSRLRELRDSGRWREKADGR